MGKIALMMEKERATAEDECDLCTRPMKPKMLPGCVEMKVGNITIPIRS